MQALSVPSAPELIQLNPNAEGQSDRQIQIERVNVVVVDQMPFIFTIMDQFKAEQADIWRQIDLKAQKSKRNCCIVKTVSFLFSVVILGTGAGLLHDDMHSKAGVGLLATGLTGSVTSFAWQMGSCLVSLENDKTIPIRKQLQKAWESEHYLHFLNRKLSQIKIKQLSNTSEEDQKAEAAKTMLREVAIYQIWRLAIQSDKTDTEKLEYERDIEFRLMQKGLLLSDTVVADRQRCNLLGQLPKHEMY